MSSDNSNFDSQTSLDDKWKDVASNVINEPSSSQTKDDVKKEAMGCISEIFPTENIDEIMTEEEVERFLRANNWNAKQAADMFQVFVKLFREFYRYVTAGFPSELDHVWSKNIVNVVENRDSEGRRVLIFSLGKWNPSDFPVHDLYTATFTLLQMISYEATTQVAGTMIVFDINGFGFKHLKALGFEELRCLGSFLSGGFPMWFRKLHIVNNPKLFNMLFNILKGFLGPRVKDNIIFHGSNLAGLHEQVPVALLPKELGGTYEEEGKSVAALKSREKEVLNFMVQLRRFSKIDGA